MRSLGVKDVIGIMSCLFALTNHKIILFFRYIRENTLLLQSFLGLCVVW